MKIALKFGKEDEIYIKSTLSVFILPLAGWLIGVALSNKFITNLALASMLWVSVITVAVISCFIFDYLLQLLCFVVLKRKRSRAFPLGWRTVGIQLSMVIIFYLAFAGHGEASRAFFIYAKGMSVMAIVFWTAGRLLLR